MKNSRSSNNALKRKGRRHTLLIVLLIAVALFILIRLALPSVILRYTNNTLQNLREYTGSVKDIDIRLYRGAFIIRDLMMDKLDEDGESDTIPLVSIETIDATIDWRSLFRGKIAGTVYVDKPVIKYTTEVFEDKEIEDDTTDFRKIIKNLVPISVNRFEVRDGRVHFIDQEANPPIDIFLSDLYINASNLSNTENSNELMPAHITAAAGMYDGNLTLDVRLDPLNRHPTFEMETELSSMNLTELNGFFKEYGNFEVQKGRFSVFSEFAGKDGRFGGYVKPFIEDFQIEKQNEGEELKQKIWESIVGTAMNILENPETDNVATRIPVNGEFVNAEVDTWEAIHYVLRNAFVEALRPTIENSINVNNMKADGKETLLEKIFGGNDDKDKKKEDEDKKGE